MFKKITPEAAGVSSEKLHQFIKMLDEYGFSTHSIIMARGEDIFLECYYKPFHKDFLHRQYSISKSFTALAVGFAEQDGLLSLDDPFMKYFPEYRNENVTERFDETTIRDMLTMRSCMVDYAVWWGKPDRVAAYFTKPSHQIAGTNYDYDSAGSFLLACIVEKLTGKPYMEYLKEKVFLDMGFSPDAYCLKAPGGHSHADSGVMCTSRDLLIFARLLARGGEWNGKQYISESFVRDAIAKQTDNNLGATHNLQKNYGYGYLIWRAPRGGFAFHGMGGQFMVHDPETDFTFVINADYMQDPNSTISVIMHELYRYVIPTVGKKIPENPEAYKALSNYIDTRELFSLSGGVSGDFANEINGKKYILEENENGFKYIKFSFDGNRGIMEYEDGEGVKKLPFGIGYNEYGPFPDKKKMSVTASQYIDGSYFSATSAIWCEERKLHILSQVIDDHYGKAHIVAAFRDKRVSVSMIKHAQRILDSYKGKFVGREED